MNRSGKGEGRERKFSPKLKREKMIWQRRRERERAQARVNEAELEPI